MSINKFPSINKHCVIAAGSWLATLWIVRVFLVSLAYKFTDHPDTQYIFGTIGLWMKDVFSTGLGEFFTQYGAYAVGTFELMTSMVLVLPLIFWIIAKLTKKPQQIDRRTLHCLGGLMAGLVMSGAVCFHLFTPLGIEVLHNGQNDQGSLFKAAVSICILGYAMFIANGCLIMKSKCTFNQQS